jgi:hypothetical protein
VTATSSTPLVIPTLDWPNAEVEPSITPRSRHALVVALLDVTPEWLEGLRHLAHNGEALTLVETNVQHGSGEIRFHEDTSSFRMPVVPGAEAASQQRLEDLVQTAAQRAALLTHQRAEAQARYERQKVEHDVAAVRMREAFRRGPGT